MGTETKKVFDYLKLRFTQRSGQCALYTLFHTFKFCSYDSALRRHTVTSSVKALNFDKLTRWLYKNEGKFPGSADALSVADNCIYLVEFKAGNLLGHKGNIKDLVENASRKINGSEYTLYSAIFPNVVDLDIPVITLNFCLVVNLSMMGIDALAYDWAQRLEDSGIAEKNVQLKRLLEQVLPDLESIVADKAQYYKVKIWYSEFFNIHLQNNGITDIESVFEDGACV